MSDKDFIFNALNKNYEISFHDYTLTSVSIFDKLTNVRQNKKDFLITFKLLFGDYRITADVSSIDIYNEWFNESYNNLLLVRNDKIDKIKTRFQYLVNFSNKKSNVR